MADDKPDNERRERSKIAAAQDFEAEFVADRYKVSVEQARELIAKHGDNREKLDLEVARLKG